MANFKTFPNTGAVIYRKDDHSYSDGETYEFRNLQIDFVHLDKESFSVDGSVLAGLRWHASSNHPYWDSPKIEMDSLHGSLGQWERWTRADSIFRSLLRRWGWYLNDYTGQDWVGKKNRLPETYREIKRAYENELSGYPDWQPSFSLIDPAVVVHVAMPLLKIERVVYDNRVARYVNVNDLMPPNVAKWYVNRYMFSLPDQFPMPSTLAVSYEEAQDGIESKAQAELDRIESGSRPLEWIWGRQVERFPTVVQSWLDADRPVIKESELFHHVGQDGPKVVPVNDLLNPEIDFYNGR